MTQVEQQEIARREEELKSLVRLPAEAEAYRMQTIAEGKRYVSLPWLFIITRVGQCSTVLHVILVYNYDKYFKNLIPKQITFTY